MNHTLGDGHTYYQVFGMLSADADVEALDPDRVAGFEKAKADIIGEEENALFSSVGIALGIVARYIADKIRRRRPQNVCVHKVDPEWVTQEKAKASEQGAVPFISANDALTSWFFREMGSDINYMIVNLRSRQPSVLGLADHNACNCEANVPYFPGDVETPALIRQSIRNEDGTFRARRAGSAENRLAEFPDQAA